MKKILVVLTLIFAAVVLATSGCSSTPNVNNNASSTNGAAPGAAESPKPALACDDTAITDSLKKTYANPPFAADAEFFNFFSKGCVVTLYGGVSTPSIRQQAIMAAEDTKGVSKVISDKFYPNTTTTSRPVPGSCACPNGYKACGDICIPNDDKCNIGGGECEGITGTPKTVKTP